MSKNRNGNRQQFRGNISTAAANLEETPKDKFEEDEETIESTTAEDEVKETFESATTEANINPAPVGESGEAGVVGIRGPEGEPGRARPVGYNYDGSKATPDNDHRTKEDREADEAALTDPVVYDETGKAIGIRGATGIPGQYGEKGPEGPRAPIEDEREDEDDPSLDQDHEETESEDGDEIVEEELDSTEESVEDEQAAIEEAAAPAFPFTEVSTWTQAELEKYISRPENMEIYHSKLVSAISIHRQLVDVLNEAWSVDDCIAFFKEGTTPAKTTTGCYVNDVTRRLRRESSWTTQELEAWALGEIKPEGLSTTNGLAAALYERFNMKISSVAPEMVIAHYKHNYGPNKGQVKLVGEIPVAKAVQPAAAEIPVIEKKIKYPGLSEMNQSYIEEALKRYCDAVRPNRVVTPKKGEEAQRELHNVVMSILKEQDPTGVKSGLDILFTKIVEERIHNPRGVFSDTNAFRFAEGIPATGRAVEIHRRLFTLFFAFIDGDEGILAQTDVPELIKYLPSHQQNLLLGYLGRN